MTTPTVLFVCLHGSAKSLIALEHFRRLAQQRGVDVQADWAGIEPDAVIPPRVVQGLLGEGIDVSGRRPRQVMRADLERASCVVTFGCELGALESPGITRERWDDTCRRSARATSPRVTSSSAGFRACSTNWVARPVSHEEEQDRPDRVDADPDLERRRPEGYRRVHRRVPRDRPPQVGPKRSCRMTEAVPDTVPCRLCTSLVARDAAVCPSCGAKDPWIPDEPTLSVRAIRVVMWGGAIVLVGLLLIVTGVLMFAPADEERDHRPPVARSETHDSR